VEQAVAASLGLIIPYNFKPREYQKPFMKAMDDGCKRAVCVWHRRAGKDKTFLNYMIHKMLKRVGSYFYYFPTATEGRRIIWDGIDRDGFRFLEHFPNEMVATKNEMQMKIRLTNGSLFQIVGTDNLNVVGPNPVGCVFSEFSRQNPQGWDYVRPILAENDGWAVFNFTPRGKNHAYQLYKMAADNPAWFCQLLTVDDTKAITKSAIQDEIDSGMSADLAQQEFYCSFELGAAGSYYGLIMAKLMRQGRITRFDADPQATVYTFWDLGISDYMSIWFAQFVGKEIHLVDFYQNVGEGLKHYAKVLQDKAATRGFVYAEHYAPHDIRNKELGTGETRLKVAGDLGIKFRVLDQQKHIVNGIEAVRGLLPRCWFDTVHCQEGIDALENYHKEYDKKRQVYHDRPEHDKYCHPADAFRYLANAYPLIGGRRMSPDDVRALSAKFRRPR